MEKKIVKRKKICSLTHELLDVEVQKDLEPSGILCRRMGPNLMLFMSQRDALCVAVTWKPYGGRGKKKEEKKHNYKPPMKSV